MNERMKIIFYWISTVLVALAMASGAVPDMARIPGVVAGMRILGYPTYFMVILGFWKALGAIAILVPGFPRLKEWAYAGIFFDLTGAAASHAAVGDYGPNGFHIMVTCFLALLTLASWALRPPSRTLGVLGKQLAR